MNDEQFQRTVSSWLIDDDITPPDSLRSARQVATRSSKVRQQSRWWPLPLLRRSFAPPPRFDAVEIVRATTTSPRRGFQSTFSATRLVLGGAIVALFGALLLAGVLTQPSEEREPAVGASASPSPKTTYVVSDVAFPRGFSHAVATDDALWVANSEGVSRIDRATSEVARISADDDLGWLIPTDDAIWAVNRDYVERINRLDLTVTDGFGRARGEPFWWQSGCVRPIIADGSLWIASPGSASHSLVEIDLATQAVRDEYIADDDWASDFSCPWLGVIGEAIWVHSMDPDGSGGRLTRFDLGTREFTDKIDDLPGTLTWPGCCVVEDTAIWLIDERSISRFDLTALAITDTLEVGRDLMGGTVTQGAIWLVDRSGGSSDDDLGVVYRIDTSTREVTDAIDVGSNPRPPAFLHGAIWVANHSRPWSVSRIDVESRRVTDTVPIPVQHPSTPLASDGVLWVPTAEGRLLRIDSDMSRPAAEAATE
jgi:hypothetical protein